MSFGKMSYQSVYKNIIYRVNFNNLWFNQETWNEPIESEKCECLQSDYYHMFLVARMHTL